MIDHYETEHHIQPGTLVGLGWTEEQHDGRPALRFTTVTGPRWRYSDGEKPKYDQNVGYAACWYGLRRAAANARLWGLDYIVDCNGAASTIAADQHRVPAFSLQSGEGTRPKPELIEQLKAAWSGRVIVAFDCDTAGRAGAIKRVQAYHDAGIEAEAVDLGLDIDGGDLADFVGAGKVLGNCQRLIIPTSEKPKAREYDRAAFGDWARTVEEIKQRLSCYDYMLQRYGEPKKRGQKHGHWLAVQRPEDTASFCAYMGAGGWYDYGPGEGGDIFDLIELVEACTFHEAVRLAAGLANVSLPGHDIITNDVTASTIISTYSGDPDWARGLSTGERGALNRYGDRVLPVLIEIAANTSEPFDIAYLVCMTADHGISETAIRKAVDRLPVVFPHSQDDLISNREEYLNSLSSDCVLELRARKIGRPAQLYALADRATVHAEIVRMAIPQIIKEAFPKKNNALQLAPPIHASFLEELGLDADEAELRAKELDLRYGADLRAQPGWREAMQEVRKRVRDLKAQLLSTDYAPLPAGAVLDKRPSLLAAAAKALISFLGGAFQMGRAKLCALIGCRDKELASVCRNAGIVIDKNAFALKPVTTLPELLAIPQKFDPKLGGFPVSVQSTFDKKPMALTSPKLTRWATDQIIAQGKLSVRYRLANHYRLAEPVVLEVKATEPVINQELIPVQQTLFPPAYVSHDTFPRYLLATLRFGLIARILNAFIMAWNVAKEAAWYIHQHADRIVPYAEAVIRKIVDVVTPWQPRGDTVTDRMTGEVKTFSVQLGFDLLLESEDTCKLPSSNLSDNGVSSLPPRLTRESTAPEPISSTSPYALSDPTRETPPTLSPPTPNITPNTTRLAFNGA